MEFIIFDYPIAVAVSSKTQARLLKEKDLKYRHVIGCYTQCTFREGPIGRENCKLDPGPQKLNHKKITKQLLNGNRIEKANLPFPHVMLLLFSRELQRKEGSSCR